MPMHEDQRFLEALLNNDHIIIDEIYKKFSGLVKTYIVNNSGDLSDAEDIFQEGIIVLFRRAKEGFELDRPFKNYFLGICRYLWLDRLKAKKVKKTKEEDFSNVTNPEIFRSIHKEALQPIVDAEAKYQLLDTKFKLLSPHCQEIIGLSWTINEMSGKKNTLKEIAEMLGRDYGYIRKEKSECIKKLMLNVKSDTQFRERLNVN